MPAGITAGEDAVIRLEAVHVWVPDGTRILRGIDWTVRAGEHWALLGPNGSGKSTLLSIAGAVRHPSQGAAAVLGGRFGEVSMWELRERIGVVDPALPLYDWLTVEEVVLTGASGTVRPRWECYGAAERARAHDLLALVGCDGLREREIKTCSQGERQRVRVARALMGDPPLLLLDEPSTGLDLPAREALILALVELARTHPTLATVLVSHHLEDLPPTITHALLLREGAVVAAGGAADTLGSEPVSSSFGFPVDVHRLDGRWTARAAASWRTRQSPTGFV